MKKLNTILLTLLISISTYAQIPTNGLIAWYPFNGNANDETGHGNNGVVNGATLTYDRFGGINKAYLFDGLNDEITTVDSSFDFANHAFSFSLWVLWNADPSLGSHIFDKQGYPLNGGNGYRLYTNSSGQICFAFSSNPTFKEYHSAFVPQIGIWYNVVVVNDDSLKAYVNNVKIISDITAIINGNNTQLTFGKRVDLTSDALLNGLLDDIHVYNRALTSQEIFSLYDESSGIQTISNNERISIYPIPCQDLIFIGGCKKVFEAVVYNISGQLLFKKKIDEGKMDISNLVSGVYIIKLITEDGSVFKKFVKD